MKSQKIDREESKKTVQVIDQRAPRGTAKSTELNLDLSACNKPVRCVNYVEVGDMERKKVQLIVQELGQMHTSAKGGIHYFIPMRNGELTTDTHFEGEFLDVVKAMCEVGEDGEIKMKDEKEVHVIRRKFE